MIARIIDLFAGAGGMTAGFVAAGFEPAYAVESDPAPASTYRLNFGDHVENADIASIASNRFPSAEVVIGGPPCQGFSLLGRRTARNRQLNGLWREFLRVISVASPTVFVLENVPQFLRSAEFALLVAQVHDLGYATAAGVLDASEFGVPQRRRRAFVIGSRAGLPSLPEGSTATRSVRDAIGHLSPPVGSGESVRAKEASLGLELHFNRNPTELSLRRYALIPPGGNRFDLARKAPDLTPRCWLEAGPGRTTDVFGRLVWDEPALTIRTEFFKPEKGRYLHPEQDRAITHLEASLLQTFNERFRWVGSKVSIARQIGNAVPPALAEAVAQHVKQLLNGARVEQGAGLAVSVRGDVRALARQRTFAAPGAPTADGRRQIKSSQPYVTCTSDADNSLGQAPERLVAIGSSIRGKTKVAAQDSRDDPVDQWEVGTRRKDRDGMGCVAPDSREWEQAGRAKRHLAQLG